MQSFVWRSFQQRPQERFQNRSNCGIVSWFALWTPQLAKSRRGMSWYDATSQAPLHRTFFLIPHDCLELKTTRKKNICLLRVPSHHPEKRIQRSTETFDGTFPRFRACFEKFVCPPHRLMLLLFRANSPAYRDQKSAHPVPHTLNEFARPVSRKKCTNHCLTNPAWQIEMCTQKTSVKNKYVTKSFNFVTWRFQLYPTFFKIIWPAEFCTTNFFESRLLKMFCLICQCFPCQLFAMFVKYN